MKLGDLTSRFGDHMIFRAEDDLGPLLVVVPIARWQELCAGGPEWMDADDRRDFALQKVEADAAAALPLIEAGQRLVRLR